jgi:hypothetical protein
MDVQPIQSTPVYTGTVKNSYGRATAQAPNDGAIPADSPRAESPAALSNEETAFFEGLFPDSRKDVRAHQAYSTTGEQQTPAFTGTLVDRKG